MPAETQADPTAMQLTRMLALAADLAREDFGGAAARQGVPTPVARAVMSLTEPAPMRDLADSLACDRSYITGVADRLEELGLVVRVTGADRRVKLLELTPKGRALRRALTNDLAENGTLTRRLSDSELQALKPLLARIIGDRPCPL